MTKYVIIDESTDSLQRPIFNVLVGPVNSKPSKQFLISTQILKHKDADSIYAAMKKGLKNLA